MSADDWGEWFCAEERKAFAVYQAWPERLLSDFRQERKMSGDYAGREILELLQNAGDAAALVKRAARVRIEVLPDGLVVANTGASFRPEGVRSLLMAHISPKPDAETSLIGQMGLGFRAVLNWSVGPVVASGEMRMAFVRRQAHAKLELAQAGEAGAALRALIGSETARGRLVPLPGLAFPVYGKPCRWVEELHEEPALVALLERSEALLGEGFDTVIGMPWKDAASREAAEQQVGELKPETLLFVPSIESVEAWDNGERRWHWRREDLGDRQVLHRHDGSARGWQVLRKFEQIETGAEREVGRRFELAVAIPEKGEAHAGCLFSFFPTEMTFPFPVLAHASMVLEQNRKQAQASRDNGKILQALAGWLVECAERWQAEHPERCGMGLKLVTRTGDLPPALVKAGWAETLVSELKGRAVVPVLDGRHVRGEEARRLPGGGSDWLPLVEFGDVVRETGGATESELLGAIDVAVLTPAEFSVRAHKVVWASVEARARFVAGMLRHRVAVETHTSTLLLDASGVPVPEKCRVFLPAGKGVSVELPPWAGFRFLDTGLRDALMRELGVREQGELQRRLHHFGLREWSLGNVCEALVAAANEARQAEGADETAITTELLSSLAALFLAERLARQRPAFPEKIALKLPSQRVSVVAEPNRLCIGAGLGERGELLQALYGGWAPEKLLLLPEVVMRGEDDETKRSFLRWLGVQEWPPLGEVKPVEPEYRAHVMRSLRFPALFGDRAVMSLAEIAGAVLTKVQMVDGLEGILAHAEPMSVLAWLALDPRAAMWKLSSAAFGELQWHPSGAWYAKSYRGALPSYVRWKIQHTAWLPTEQGAKEMPGKCLVGETSLAGLLPTPTKPMEETWRKFGVPTEAVRDAWNNAGVMLGFAGAPWSEVYQLLGDLPARDPEGKVARSLYRVVLEQADSFVGDADVAGKTFRESGRMWGVQGTRDQYWPVVQLRYLYGSDLPGALVARLALVAVDRKGATKKIELRFGVRAVETAKIRVTVIETTAHPQAEALRAELARAKPWLWALREARGGVESDRRRLEALNVDLCERVVTRVGYEMEEDRHELDVWEVVRIETGIYVCVGPTVAVSLASDLLARAVGDEIAALLSDSRGDDFGWLLRCAEADRGAMLKRLVPVVEMPSDGGWPIPPMRQLTYHEPPVTLPRTALAGLGSEVVPRVTPTGPLTPLGPLVIEALPHTPELPAQRMPLLIQPGGAGGGGGSTGTRREVTDWELCEAKAAEFEEHAESGRYAVRVGHITGYDGPRCDVLSFQTAEARDAFLRDQKIVESAVARFIEVKARADERARIVLKDNALDAAKKYGERYYLYRFFEEADGSLVLTMVGNPLVQTGARPIYEIDLERSNAQKRRLRGGKNSSRAAS